MFYEINVAKNGKHFFATAERSAVTFYEAERLYKILTEKFPQSEGYEVSCRYYEETSKLISFENKEE